VVGVEFLKKYVWSSSGEGARDERSKGHNHDLLRVFLSGNGVPRFYPLRRARRSAWTAAIASTARLMNMAVKSASANKPHIGLS
jgi:hypothetical protein